MFGNSGSQQDMKFALSSEQELAALGNPVTYLHTDNREVKEHIIGIGGSGIVIRHENHAVKIPKLRRRVEWIDGERMVGRLTPPRPGDYDERKISIKTLMDEKAIYARIQGSGIVPCFDLVDPHHSIRMKLMVNGDLRHHLVRVRPDQQTQITWLKDLAQTFAQIHKSRIIVADIRTDNILLDENFDVKVADFGNSIMMPLSWDLQGTVEEGYSVATDIAEFGTVIFEIVTGQHCRFDLYFEWEHGEPMKWPPRHTLPSTNGVWLGDIIEQCWSQEHGFASMEDVLAAMKQEFAKTSTQEL